MSAVCGSFVPLRYTKPPQPSVINAFYFPTSKEKGAKNRLMKKTILLITSLIFLNQMISEAQEITATSTFSHSSYENFRIILDMQ